MAETALRSTTGTTAAATGGGAGPTIHRLTGTHCPAPRRVPPRRPGPAHRPAPPRPPRHPRAACDSSGLAPRFALRLVEVLAGLRPVGQLARHTTHDGYRQLARLASDGPLRRADRTTRPRLAQVHECAPGPGVLEVCVRVETGERHRVVAFRLERHWRTEQWQCAAVEAR
ncbi:Rv3235 family protein [Kitasatospora sp. NBC_01266]|uniref:Rv3235 family protein n=1 Tax=Kitasatospora sp. NBC_01266 TaxID=2903572 RepID=UPI002E3509E0|nr:Rv3235 family protein [Kitasatospora sp. NBC_01266]